MTKWQMLSLVFNGVNFFRNSIFCRFFFFFFFASYASFYTKVEFSP